jgi:hypothetical protein
MEILIFSSFILSIFQQKAGKFQRTISTYTNYKGEKNTLKMNNNQEFPVDKNYNVIVFLNFATSVLPA